MRFELWLTLFFRRWYALTYCICPNLYEFVCYCMIILDYFSQKLPWVSVSHFHGIFGMICHIASKLFNVITQPWRHLGAILWFHVIIHIFTTRHHKLIKFTTHLLQVMGQHINISLSACASRRTVGQDAAKLCQNYVLCYHIWKLGF